MILDANDKKLEFVLDGAVATNELSFTTSYADKSVGAFTPAGNDGVSNGTTPVTLVAAPAASTQRMISGVSIFNDDTVDAVVTVSLDNNGTDRTVIKVTLGAGESLHFFTDTGWYCLSSGGLAKTIVGAGDNLIGRVDARNGDKIWSFKEALSYQTSNLTLDAGINGLYGPAVPAGEVWRITTMVTYYAGTAPTDIVLGAEIDSVSVFVKTIIPVVSGRWYGLVTDLILDEGDYPRAYVEGATLNDDFYFRYAGYIMQV